MPEQATLADEGINQSFGYKQELRRALKLFSLYAVAFSIISITTGLFTNYALGLSHLGPAMIWLWPVAAIGQMLVALVVAELGTRIPLAGYSYQWGARLVNTTYGWFTGFVGLAYLSVGAAAINFVVVAPIVATILGLDPLNATSNLVITVVIFLAVLTINIISITLAARINNVAVFTEIVGMVGFGLILFILWATKPLHPITFLFDTGGVHGADILAAIPFAALMGIFTIVGFELAADLGEEAVSARVTVPKAVVWSVASSAILGMVALIGFTIAIPDLAKTAAAPVPLAYIVTYWMGDVDEGLPHHRGFLHLCPRRRRSGRDRTPHLLVRARQHPSFLVLASQGQPADADPDPRAGDRVGDGARVRRLGLHQLDHGEGDRCVLPARDGHGDATVHRLLPDGAGICASAPSHGQAA
jgi:hypothetical protein